MPNGNVGAFEKVDLSETFEAFSARLSQNKVIAECLKPQAMRRLYDEAMRGVHYRSDTYHVYIDKQTEHGFQGAVLWHLSIKRHDREPIMDWRDLQAIKTALCGAEAEAMQLFPAESRVVDTANQYHLFVLMKLGGIQFPRLPFGWTQGARTDEPGGAAVQRVGATIVKDSFGPKNVFGEPRAPSKGWRQ